MEPWEGLDVDDSDLHSLLRPCKRLHLNRNPISTPTGISVSQPALVPCSNTSKTLVEKERTEEEDEPEQQIVERSRANFRDISEQHCRIPGPAGDVQAAMLRKDIDRQNLDFSSSQCANPIATQEYIRRAMEENAPEFDDDFNRNAWISALQYIGARDGVLPSIPLSFIKECKIEGKADQVVAVIKSSTQNALGGMMVTLKDPTGTICASVHAKVLGESSFGKDFSVGSVVILQKVAIFSLLKSVHYLNITLRNVLKVFNKDIGLPSHRNNVPHFIEYAIPVCSGRAGSPQNINPELRSSEVPNEMTRCTNKEASSHYNSQIHEDVLYPRSSKCSSRSSFCKNVVPDNDPMTLGQDCVQEISEGENIKKTTDDKQDSAGDSEGRHKLCNLQDNFTSDDAEERLTMSQNCRETTPGGNVVQSQNQPPLVAASLPKWTDEQLAELFADDDENDDGSFF